MCDQRTIYLSILQVTFPFWRDSPESAGWQSLLDVFFSKFRLLGQISKIRLDRVTSNRKDSLHIEYHDDRA